MGGQGFLHRGALGTVGLRCWLADELSKSFFVTEDGDLFHMWKQCQEAVPDRVDMCHRDLTRRLGHMFPHELLR